MLYYSSCSTDERFQRLVCGPPLGLGPSSVLYCSKLSGHSFISPGRLFYFFLKGTAAHLTFPPCLARVFNEDGQLLHSITWLLSTIERECRHRRGIVGIPRAHAAGTRKYASQSLDQSWRFRLAIWPVPFAAL